MSVDADSPLAQLVQQADVISAIDNEAIQSSDQAVKMLNQRGRPRPVDDQPRSAGERRDATPYGPAAVINPLSAALETISAGNGLSIDVCRASIGVMLDGRASDDTMAAFEPLSNT